MNYHLIALLIATSLMRLKSEDKSALLVVDLQNCFVEGGSLAVVGGASLPPIINSIIDQYKDKFAVIAYTIDFHPVDHISFASQHEGKHPYSLVQLYYDANGRLCEPTTLKDPSRAEACSGELKEIKQMLWPDHCVANTDASNLVPSLHVLNASNVIFIHKGTERNIDSYSAFSNNGHFSHTELNERLEDFSIKKLFIAGIATDYCVKFAALDAKELGYDVYVLKEAIAGFAQDTSEQAMHRFQEIDVHVINTEELYGRL